MCMWVNLKGTFRAINQAIIHLFVWIQRGRVTDFALHAKQEDMGGRVIAPPQPRGWTTVPILEAGWALWPFWTSLKYFASNLVRNPFLPARSESQYRLCYTSLSMREGIRIFTARSVSLWVEICRWDMWKSRQVTAAFSNPLFLPHFI
jgi:hypothetical protein